MTRDKKDTELIARGRHDPCVVPRGKPNQIIVLPWVFFRSCSLILFSHVLEVSYKEINNPSPVVIKSLLGLEIRIFVESVC